jgi:phage terminase large subunit-like protein
MPRAPAKHRPKPAIPAEWKATVFGVPGYDPTKGADGCWFDPAAAALACDFFAEMLVHIEGDMAVKPFALEPWQKSVVANLFGWKKRNAKGQVVRRFRELFLYVPRKNGKTPLAAGVGLFLFFCDPEAGQQGYIAAKDREQAGLLFRQMDGMVKANPMLKDRCRVYGGTAPAGQSKSFVKPDASFLKIISGDGGGKHGGNPHVVIVDELHEQQGRELVDALTTSMVSANRSQSLFISLTTADFDRPSICNDKYQEAKRVQADPAKDPAFLPVVFEADPADDPYSPATWRKANPNLGVSVGEEELGRLARKAQEEPAFDVEFKRLHLNLRTRKLVENAIPIDRWDACGEAFDPAILLGRPCWAGLDFGWRDDYAALVLTFPGEAEADPVYVRPYFWLPEEAKRDVRANPTRGFVAGGHVTLTDGNSTDVEAIYEALRDVSERYDLRRIAFDPANARKQGQDFQAMGFDVCEFYQSHRNFTEPWRWLMADGLTAGRLRHGGHPVLRWMAGNVSCEVNGLDGVMPKKRKSAEKIDGVTALGMALGAWLTDEDRGGSVYESRGLIVLGGIDSNGEVQAEGPAADPDAEFERRRWARAFAD